MRDGSKRYKSCTYESHVLHPAGALKFGDLGLCLDTLLGLRQGFEFQGHHQ